MGALHSTILLPASWREWDDVKLDAVITHEVSHVARRDGLTLRLSLLHRAVFWFSPLAWWLDRHLADLAEQASDEAALSFGTDRKDYARTLLGFFEALQVTSGRVWWQGVSMAKAGQAEKRLERILSWKGSVAMRLKKSIAVAVLTLAVPVVYFADSVHDAIAKSQTPEQAHAAS
jgi:beta-lactamase regulating signal transducer with metallopeptidase domain